METETLINAFVEERNSTNLVADSEFHLPKAEQRTGFLGVFNGAYPGSELKTLMKVGLGALIDTAGIPLGRPPRAVSQEEKADARQATKRFSLWLKERENSGLSYYTKLKKVSGSDPHFVLHLPVVLLSNPYALSTAITAVGGSAATVPTEVYERIQNMEHGSTLIPTKLCVQNAKGISPAASEMLTQSLLGVEIEATPKGTAVFLVFKIPSEVCEFLVNTPWMEIRPVDLYPLFAAWVSADYDRRKYGKISFPLSRISSTLPPHAYGDMRVDAYDLSVDMSGNPFWLPTCDHTDEYEQKFNACGTREDGSFQLMSPDQGMLRTALPADIPILTDWINFKFTYSNGSGKPTTLNLEHFRKCNASMAWNILKTPVAEDWVKQLATWAQAVAMPAVLTRDESYGAEENLTLDRYFGVGQKSIDLGRYVAMIFAACRDEAYTPRYLDLSSAAEDVRFRPLGVFISQLQSRCVENAEALYTRYRVDTVIKYMGYLRLVSAYADKAETEANTANKAYKEQGDDPNWTPPPMPMVAAKMNQPTGGLLPHQARIRNMLREAPDFAVLAVPAGGGKSPMAITDILQEIQRGAKGPFILMCPSFLVANYVSEIVEFTDGKLNCIPVTSYNIRVTGIPRYEEILKAAPVNTVFVVDFNVVKFRPKTTVYGTTAITVYPVVEMIRRFKPKYVLVDEVHLLKNAKSSRFKAVMSLIADIPKKRIASGTLNPDSPSDLPGQIAILDPTILGTRDEFNAKYGEDVKGGRVMKWRTKGQNSLADVMASLKENVVWCRAQRKEWACALPKRKDRFIPVELSDNQLRVYNAIFDDMIQSLKKKAETDKGASSLLDKLNKKKGKKASQEDDDAFDNLVEDQAEVDDGDDEDLLDESDDAGPSLQPYLADIERFVTNPMFHPYAKDGFINAQGQHVPPLTGDDQIPPKIRELISRMKTDYNVLDPKYPKTIIFVNYSESAKAVMDNMPPELAACGLLYSAADKTAAIAKFVNDDKVRWMVGIRSSMEVGLNLQKGNVLVRLENCWTQGEQEQGDSRIARPYFGPGGDQRPILIFDTIVADRTIDVTKAARLRAKIIAIAKFENIGNPNYDAIENIPIIPMTLDAILTQNDFTTNLAQYAHAMANLNQVINDENEQEKRRVAAEGGLKFTQIPPAPTPEGCAMLSRVPYAQGTALYKASELGLVRVDNFLGMELAADDSDEEEGEDTEDDASGNPQKDAVMGLRCHTEQGDGYIIGAGGRPNLRFVQVMCDDGTTVIVNVTAAFIVTRTETNGVDMRNKIAEAAGLSVTGAITVPAASAKVTKMTKKMIREQERREEEERKAKRDAERADRKAAKKALSVSLQLNLVNGFMQVSFAPDSNPAATKAMEALGFVANPTYYYAQIKTHKQLIAQATAWMEDGFEISKQVNNDTFQILAQEFASGGLKTHRDYARTTNSAEFRNYMRTEWKASADKKVLRMFALITDGGIHNKFNRKQAEARSEKEGAEVEPNYGIAYLCLPAGPGHPASKAAISSKYKVPGTTWYIADPVLSKFVGSIAGVHKILEELREAGIRVNNIAELNQHARSVKKIAPRVDDSSVIYKDLGMADVKDAPTVKTRKKAVEPAPTLRKKAVSSEPVKTRRKVVEPVRKTKAVEPPARRQRAVEPTPTVRKKAVTTRR